MSFDLPLLLSGGDCKSTLATVYKLYLVNQLQNLHSTLYLPAVNVAVICIYALFYLCAPFDGNSLATRPVLLVPVSDKHVVRA